MSIYTCSKCLFCFESASAVENCPDCGNLIVRYATNEEAAEYKRNRAEFSGSNEREKVRQSQDC